MWKLTAYEVISFNVKLSHVRLQWRIHIAHSILNIFLSIWCQKMRHVWVNFQHSISFSCHFEESKLPEIKRKWNKRVYFLLNWRFFFIFIFILFASPVSGALFIQIYFKRVKKWMCNVIYFCETILNDRMHLNGIFWIIPLKIVYELHSKTSWKMHTVHCTAVTTNISRKSNIHEECDFLLTEESHFEQIKGIFYDSIFLKRFFKQFVKEIYNLYENDNMV